MNLPWYLVIKLPFDTQSIRQKKKVHNALKNVCEKLHIYYVFQMSLWLNRQRETEIMKSYRQNWHFTRQKGKTLQKRKVRQCCQLYYVTKANSDSIKCAIQNEYFHEKKFIVGNTGWDAFVPKCHSFGVSWNQRRRLRRQN